jgi:hypothetical protein
MKILETKKQLSRVEEARGVIARAPQGIENEFVRTKNSWLECFGSSIFALETFLDCDKVKAEIGDEQFRSIIQKIADLKDRHSKLKQLYPNKATIPPDEIKQELLKKLNVLE